MPGLAIAISITLGRMPTTTLALPATLCQIRLIQRVLTGKEGASVVPCGEMLSRNPLW